MADTGEGGQLPEGKVKVSVKCRPNQLCELIEKLNDAQRAAVRRIGFGGLLELKLRSFPLARVPDFLNAFSDESYVFRASELKEFVVTKYDVYDCFMIPCGPNPVDLVPTGHQTGSQDPENKRLKDRWRRRYNVEGPKDGVNLGVVFKDILDEKYKKGGPQFCRLFVLLAMSSFLAPTSYSAIDFKLLRAVADVKAIPQYDWCSYVLENTAKAAASVGTKKKTMLGCIPFLMIIYFHRFDFRGKSCPHDLPLIKHWDREKLADRLRRELDYSELGRQTWSRVKYPRCVENQLMPIADLSTDNTALMVGDTVAGGSKQLSGLPHKRFIELELPPGVEDDADLKGRALDDVHELYLKMQRNAIVFYNWYSNAAMTLKGLTSGASSSSGSAGTQATQSFFRSQKMKEYALDIEQLAARLKSSTEGAPVLQHDGSGAVDLSDDEDPEDEEEEEVEGETEDETEEEEEEEVEGESEDEDDEEEAVEKEVEVEETYGEEDEEQGEEEEGEEERDGEEVGGDAVELCTQQIMDTVKFYAADEFAETERPLARQMENERDAKSLEFFSSREIKVIYKRRKVVEKPVPVIQPLIEPEMTDDEILHQFYTPEQLDEAYRKAAAMEEARKEQARMENPNDAERGAEGSDQAEPSEKLTIEEVCQDQSSTENPIGGHVDSFGDENVACESMFSEPSGTQFLFTTAEINDAELAASGSDQADHAVAEKEIIVQSVGVDSQRPVDTNPELTVADYAAKSPDFTSTPFCSVDIHDAFQGVESPVSADVQQGEHKPGQPKDVSVDQFLDDVVVDQSEEVDGVNLSKITEEIDGGGALLDEAVKSTESDIAVVERKDKEHGDLEVVTPELGVGMNPLECTSTVYSESQLEEAFKGVGDKANVCADLPEGSAARSNPNQDVYVPRSELSHHPFLLHSSAPLSCMEHIMENLGCSIDCGAPNPDLIFATQNLEFSQSLLAPVFELRKYVMDYVFNSSGPFNRWEQLVTFSIFYFITREDLATLVPRQQVMTSVIDGWCLLLNHIMITGPGIISRCFFGLSHTHPARDIWRARKVGKVLTKDEDVFGGWENWAATCSTPLQIDADLIFLPVLSGDGDHYSCACINFLSEQIEYLDVRTYDEDLGTLPYGGIARIAANLMRKYLCSKGLSRGAKVSSFKLVNIEFPWQGTGYNENDCGMYMMLAMMFYEGKLFECGLGDEEAMKLFRAEVAATLVLCDINKDRSNVLRRVEAFKEFTGHPLTRKLNVVKRKTSCELEPESIKRARVEEKELILSVTPVSMRLPVDRALSAVKSQPRGRGDGLGCTIDCGRGGYNTLVVSKFLRNNQALLKGIKTLRKHVADYCLLDDHIFDHREQVVWYGRHAALQRADMLSMAPDKLLSPVVIECWAILLNHLEKEEYGEQARMSFFGIRHMELLLVLLPTFEQKGTQTDSDVDALYQIWDTFIVDSGRTVNLNTDLLFVPLTIDDHLACVCINFRSKTIDLLDHQRYLDVNKTQMGKAARLIGGAMSDYLDARAIARARDIVTFPVRQIYFSGCSPTVNKPESGLFTMMAMLLYEGIPFAHEDLEGKKARRFLVVQLIATLLLADLNVIRESVLLKMKPFIADKDKLWKHLQVQRRNYQGPARK